jgi:hypothetical protein
MKQLILAALLAIIALITPGGAGAAEFDQSIGPNDSTLSGTPADQAQGAGGNDVDSSQASRSPRWTVSADCIILDRVGGANQTLVERVPGTVPFDNVAATSGIQALNSNNLNQGFAPGLKLGLIRHGDSDFDVELSYFQVNGWSDSRAIGPDNPLNWLVMKAPGGFFQTQDWANQAMQWDYSTELYNAELNLRWNLSSRVTMIAGFRWLQLHENLQGSLPPPDLYIPTWKAVSNQQYPFGYNLNQVKNLTGPPATGAFPPFWNTDTTNNLYGLQIGADAKIFENGRFSIDGVVKAGAYCNHAEESTGVSIAKDVRPSSASTDQASFIGETGLQCKYRLTRNLVLKAGYEALWLEGLALAPGQIQETYTTHPATVSALGVNSGSGLLFHGATTGLEYSF